MKEIRDNLYFDSDEKKVNLPNDNIFQMVSTKISNAY